MFVSILDVVRVNHVSDRLFLLYPFKSLLEVVLGWIEHIRDACSLVFHMLEIFILPQVRTLLHYLF